MPQKRKPPNLSSGEMEIMAMLWHEGPLTLARAHRAFGRYGRPVGYPTMQTRLNRLAGKGWLRRTSDRPARYEPAVSVAEVSAAHLERLPQGIRRSHVVPLVAHLISERPLTAEEIQELRRLLEQAEQSSQARDQGD
jgi:BlaI family transcriptional regulator, penicillinase repressor